MNDKIKEPVFNTNPIQEMELSQRIENANNALNLVESLTLRAAKIQRKYFTDLKKAGFSHQDALDLVKFHGPFFGADVGGDE